MLSERKTLTEAQRSLEAVEPHPPRDHHRWTFPVGIILAVVLTVPGPSALPAAEIAARTRPPRPRTRRNPAPAPVGRPSPAVGARPPSAA